MENKAKHYSRICWSVFITGTVLSFFLSGRLSGKGYLSLLTPYCITVILTCLLEAVAKNRRLPAFGERAGVITISAGFFLSMLLLSLGPKAAILTLWMAGGIVIGGLLNPYLGAGFHLIFTYLYCSLYDHVLEEFIYLFVIGTIMCMLAGYMKSFYSFLYVAVIAFSMDIIFLFALNHFILHNSLTRDGILSAVIGIIILFATFLLKVKYAPAPLYWSESDSNKKFWEEHNPESLQQSLEPLIDNENREYAESVSEQELLHVLKQNEEKENSLKMKFSSGQPDDMEQEFDYRKIITSDAPLMQRLNDELPGVYRHSLLISLLSEKAAGAIHGNRLLAKAGGMYHEIGRLNEGDYIEQGVILANEHDFPKELIQILAEQNFKLTKPSSKESAIVMLTDTIITTIKYFEKDNDLKRPSHEKLIEDIFDVRFEQGGLDDSGLTLADYKKLKEFYHSNIPKK